jgi:type VI secretion system secreted protein Hcp
MKFNRGNASVGRAVLILVSLVLAVPTALPAQEKVSFYLTVTGKKQGQFKGEATSAQHKNQIGGLRYFYQVTEPQNMATGQVTGKRQRSAVNITKEWGAASPQFQQAMINNEVLSAVVIEFSRVGLDGKEQVFQRITLTDCTVSGIRQFVNYPVDNAPADPRPLEEIGFIFRTMQMEDLIAHTTVTDSRME